MKPSVNPIAPAMPAPPLYRHHHLPITPFVPIRTSRTRHTRAVFIFLFFKEKLKVTQQYLVTFFVSKFSCLFANALYETNILYEGGLEK